MVLRLFLYRTRWRIIVDLITKYKVRIKLDNLPAGSIHFMKKKNANVVIIIEYSFVIEWIIFILHHLPLKTLQSIPYPIQISKRLTKRIYLLSVVFT